jgi:hypothetical protein
LSSAETDWHLAVIGFRLDYDVEAGGTRPEAIVANVIGRALVAPVLDLKAQEVSDIVHQVLESAGVLGARFTQALLDEVPGVAYVFDLARKIVSKSLAGRIVAGAVVGFSNEFEDDIQRVGHGGFRDSSLGGRKESW